MTTIISKQSVIKSLIYLFSEEFGYLGVINFELLQKYEDINVRDGVLSCLWIIKRVH